jgi:hypothetical protein
MDYERSTSISTKPIESKKVTLIWSNDGWCYIPQLNLRQRFTEKLYYSEEWKGVIALPEHIETIEWALYSREPKVWREQNEVLSLKKKAKSKQANKKMRQPTQ